MNDYWEEFNKKIEKEQKRKEQYSYVDIDKLNIDNDDELRKLKKMINLSLNNPNENESKAAMRMAEKFAKRHRIDLENILNNIEDTKKNVYQKYITMPTSKYGIKYRCLYDGLLLLQEVLPVEIYMTSKRKIRTFQKPIQILGYSASSNFKDTIVIFDELFEYIKHIYKIKSKDYLISFIIGFRSVFAKSYDIRALIPYNDTGINPTTKCFDDLKEPNDFELDAEGFEHGKKWVSKKDIKHIE